MIHGYGLLEVYKKSHKLKSSETHCSILLLFSRKHQNINFIFMYICVCVHAGVCVCVFIPIPEDNLQELVLSFYHVDSGHRIQVVRLGGKYFYLLSHFQTPLLILVELSCVSFAWL